MTKEINDILKSYMKLSNERKQFCLTYGMVNEDEIINYMHKKPHTAHKLYRSFFNEHNERFIEEVNSNPIARIHFEKNINKFNFPITQFNEYTENGKNLELAHLYLRYTSKDNRNYIISYILTDIDEYDDTWYVKFKSLPMLWNSNMKLDYDRFYSFKGMSTLIKYCNKILVYKHLSFIQPQIHSFNDEEKFKLFDLIINKKHSKLLSVGMVSEIMDSDNDDMKRLLVKFINRETYVNYRDKTLLSILCDYDLSNQLASCADNENRHRMHVERYIRFHRRELW